VRTAPAVRDDRDAFGPIEWGLFGGLGLIWGASFMFISIGLDAFHPGLITWLRVGLGAATLVVARPGRRRIAPPDRGRVLVLSLIWVAIPFTLFPLAELHINSAVTGLLNGSTPMFAAVIGGLFFGRPSRGSQRVGLVIGFVGIVLVSLGTVSEGDTALLGIVLVLAASFCYGWAPNLAGPLQRRYGSTALMAQLLIYATVLTSPLGLFGVSQSEWAVGPAAAVAVLGPVGTGLAFVMMASLVGRVGAPRAAFITYIIPLVSLVLGVVFLDDQVTRLALVGAAVVVTGAVLAARREA
jgi:drug/metabolite transporter (DMT)-like permease